MAQLSIEQLRKMRLEVAAHHEIAAFSDSRSRHENYTWSLTKREIDMATNRKIQEIRETLLTYDDLNISKIIAFHQADNRRTWGTRIATGAVYDWNGCNTNRERLEYYTMLFEPECKAFLLPGSDSAETLRAYDTIPAIREQYWDFFNGIYGKPKHGDFF